MNHSEVLGFNQSTNVNNLQHNHLSLNPNRLLKIVIIGGGSTYTPGIVSAMLSPKKTFNIGELVLYDIDADRNQDMYQIVKYLLLTKGRSDIKLSVSQDAKECFAQTDFFFCQIRVGGLAMRELDEKIPLRHGLVGQETCGVGGFAYGMRSMPAIIEIVDLVQRYAPEAWLLNYTNPESIVAEAVRRRFPHARMLNVCDMTISIEETICQNYGYDRTNWLPVYYGLNHFGWYQEIYDKQLGRDVLPEIVSRLRSEGLKTADFNANDLTWQYAYDELCMLTEMFPEHIPNNYLAYYLLGDQVKKHLDSKYSRANYIQDHRLKNTREMALKIHNLPSDYYEQGDVKNILNFNFGEHGQYIVDIATSILHDLNLRFMLIVPNYGAIPNLRSDAVVEVPAYVNARGAEPIALRNDIPDFHKGLMEAQVAAEKLWVDAFFEHSYAKALQAFTLNRTVPSAIVAKQVLDDLIEANIDYWVDLN